MNTLLLNGCSFGECWNPTLPFTQSLGCDVVVNLSKPGTSFQRTCRSTVEWLSQNIKPAMVLIPITFAHRWELSLGLYDDPIDGRWVPIQNSNFIPDDQRFEGTTIEDVKKLVDDYFKIISTVATYWDKMFTEIIMLSGFLDANSIPYLMWDMCNGFEKKHIKDHKGFKKIEIIEKNPKIIDLWNFCGNSFMRDTMTDELKTQTPEFAHHHAPEQYKFLERHLIDYIRKIKK